MVDSTTRGPSRADRRKARTREALVAAAQRLIAEGRSTASIQDITDAADVGFGSFYNHFDSKGELFEEAVHAALERHARLLASLTGELTDPAEVFAASFRLTGRLQRRHPELIAVVLAGGGAIMMTERGLRPRALADIDAGARSGRFSVRDPEVAVLAAGGVLLGLLTLLEARPELDDAAISDEFAKHALMMLGLSPADADEICRRPLPPLGTEGQQF